MPRARVAHVTTVHRPLDVRIFHKECRSLAAAGYEVHLLANDPPAEEIDGVRLHPVHRPPGRSRYLPALQDCWRQARRIRAELYHLHDPELIPLGLALKAAGAKVVYDVHEDAPREARTLFSERPRWGRFKASVLEAFEASARLGFDRFVCATPDIASGFPDPRTVTVPNYPLIEEFPDPGSGRTPQASRASDVLYLGTIFRSRGLFEMLEAVAKIPADRGVRLRLFGAFQSDELNQEATRHAGWSRTHFGGWLDRTGVAEESARARAGLVLLHPEPAFLTSLPVKLFEYMAAGLPVIASDFPLWRDIVKGAGCGLLVEPRAPDQIAEAIVWILDHPKDADEMGRRGRQAVLEHYNWSAVAPTLIGLYEALLTGLDAD